MLLIGVDMKWTKLKYGKWPKGMILVRLEAEEGDVHYEIGFIQRNAKTGDSIMYCNKPMPGMINMDSIYDIEPHYIQLDHIEMPEAEDEQL